MKNFNLYKYITVFFFLFCTNLFAEPHYLDFKYILNESNAGKQAQKYLKEKLETGMKAIKKREKNIIEEEKKIIQQKKVISAEEYKKKVTDLRNKVSSLKDDRSKMLNEVGKQRAKAKAELLKNLNPLIQEYMKEKKIRMVLDKKSLLLADENLDITEDIIKLLNKKLKSIKLN